MGTISRHAGSPFAQGETLEAADLEADFNTAYVEINGQLDNNNVKTGADIDGAKLKNSTLTALKIFSSTLGTSVFAPAALPKSHVSIATNESWTAATSLADVAGITDASLLPGSANDTIFMDFCATVDNDGDAGLLTMGWHINDVDYDDITTLHVVAGDTPRLFYSTYAITAPATSLMTIKPRHKVDLNDDCDIDSAVFRCWILPGK